MKKTILLAAGIVLPLFIFSQIGFQKFYGRPSTFQEIRAIVPMDDGGFLLGGTNGDTNGNGDDFWIVKTDSLGNEEWSENHGTYLNEKLYFLNKTPDGGYLIAGTQGGATYKRDLYVLKINSDYEFEWDAKLTDNNDASWVGGVYVEENGDIYISFSQNSKGTFFKLNAAGEFEWSKAPFTINKATGVTPTDDGHYFLHGSLVNYSNGVSINKVFKVKPNGNLVLVEEINGSSEVRAVTYANLSGHHVLYGASGVITKIDDDGEIIWQHSFYQTGAKSFKIIDLGNDEYLAFDKRGIRKIVVNDTWANNTEYKYFDGFTSHEILAGEILPTGGLLLVGNNRNDDKGIDGFALNTNEIFDEKWQIPVGDLAPSGDDEGGAVLQTPDDGYVMGGCGYFSGSGKDFYIIKTDSTGMVEWELNDGDLDEAENIFDIALTADEGLLFSGWAKSSPDTVILKVLKTDLQGNLLWKKSYLHSFRFRGMQSVALQDTGAVIAYTAAVLGAGISPTYMKVGTNGDSLWTKKLNETHFYNRFFKTILTSDNHLLSVGRVPSDDSGWIFKTDLNGNIIFDLSFEIDDPDFYRFTAVAESSYGTYLIPFSKSKINSEIDSLFILEVNENGTINQKVLLSTSYSNVGACCIDKISSDEYLFSLTANEDSIYIIHLNADFDMLTISQYRRDISQGVSDTDATSDNGLVLFGDMLNMNSDDFYLVKTWPNGAVKTIEINPLGQMSIYPNPADSDLSVSFESPYLGPVEISIISSSGQRLRHFKEEKSSTVFQGTYQLNGLPPGAYFVQLAADGRRITRAWIKQ